MELSKMNNSALLREYVSCYGVMSVADDRDIVSSCRRTRKRLEELGAEIVKRGIMTATDVDILSF